MLKFLRKTKLYVFAFPILLWILGAGLNQIAINANYDSMPVLYNVGNVDQFIDHKNGFPKESVGGTILTDERHSVLTPDSHVYLLCDIIDFGDVKYSVGDFLIKASRTLDGAIPYIWGLALYSEVRKREDE
jgi:hypothetical protein